MKSIEKLEYLVTKPSEGEYITSADIAEYLFHLTRKINEIIEVLNTKK